MKLVLPGGTGQVGQIVARHFHGAGHEVVVLGRAPAPAAWRTVAWDGRALGPWASELDGAAVVLNLAGRNVNCRYTEDNRREIMDSRVDSTRVVGEAIARAARPPRVWLQASTATIYAHTFGPAHDEATGRIGGTEPDAPARWGFSIAVARAWEAALAAADTPGTRKVALRTSMVMSPDRGGIFDTLATLVRRGLGGAAGTGRQYVSWIHHRDFVRAVEWLLAHEDVDGIVNVTAPAPLPYAEFMRELRIALGVPIGLPATEWMLAIGAWFMRTETELVLKSRRVSPGRLAAAGFTWDFPTWDVAVKDLTGTTESGQVLQY